MDVERQRGQLLMRATLQRPSMGSATQKPEPGTGRISRRLRKQVRLQQTKRENAIETREAIEAERQRRIECFVRDHGRCRAFGLIVKLVTDNAFKLAHLHHLVFRSRGGSDELFNRCILSPKAHELVHAGLLKIDGDDAAKPLLFTLRDAKGIIERVWER